MLETQTIIAGGGAQDVEVYAFDALGRMVKPTSATVGIVNLDFTESDADADRIVLAAATAATVDTVSTTTTAATGPREPDARLLPMTSAAGFTIGRHYAITAAGNTEAFEVAGVSSNNVYARHELRASFATGATVTGLRVSVAFPSATANDAAELERRSLFGVDWTFVGVTGRARVRTFARLERRHRPPRASISDLLLLDPNLAAASHDTVRLESHLQHAEVEIDAHMMHRGSQLANTVEGQIGKLAVVYRALELAYRLLGDEFETRATWAADQALEWRKMLLDGHRADDQTETSRPKDRQTPRRRAVLPGVIVGAT